MALEAGTRLGSYEILSPLGAGGMGEVYRARDGKLDRDVAIKTLPEDLARDPERLVRSEREAKLLASLNHPNIAAIYGFEEHEGTRFLVLEQVEGPTLADRIAQAAIPVDEAIPIAKQIAEALEAAHGQGIIHLASVLQREPDWDALPKDVPPVVTMFLRRCLAKDPRQRVHDIADVRLALEGAFGSGDARADGEAPHRQWPRAGAVAAVTALVVAGAAWSLWPRPRLSAVTRLTITPPASAPLRIDGRDRDLVITPDGTRVIYAVESEQGTQLMVRALDDFESHTLALLDLATGRYETLLEGGSHAHYVASGHLVFVNRNVLLAAPFDLRARQVRGTPVPVVPSLYVMANGGADLSVSSDGTLVYVEASERTAWTGDHELVWVDREGQATTAVERVARYLIPRVSPGGDRIAITITAGDGNPDVWILEPARGGVRARALHLVRVDGSEPAAPLTETRFSQVADSWSPDGTTLAFHEIGRQGHDLFLLQPGQSPTPLLATPFYEWAAAFSPDGRWLAYVSDESGLDEVYIRPYPGAGARIAISNGGGRWPLWSRDGRQLFYRDHFNGGRMMSVSIEGGRTLRPGLPQVLFDGNFTIGGINQARNYDIAPDGRFLMLRPVGADTEEQEPPQIRVVLNWHEELKRLAPVD